jgi:hypothetical protein
MTDDVLKPTYVVFSRCSLNEKQLIVFFGEYTDLADAEQIKADKNRNMPTELSEFTVTVGVASFMPHEFDEALDHIEVVPRDGSEKFKWSEMIDGKELAQLKMSKK